MNIQQFGLMGLFGTLIIVGSFYLLGVGVTQGAVNFEQLLPLVGTWIGGIVSGYLVVKTYKSTKE